MSPHTQPPSRVLTIGVGLVAAMFLTQVVASTWTCDDALISLRVVENLVHGHGLRWNPDDRVQVFTHPAWVLLLAAARWLTDARIGVLVPWTQWGLIAAALAVLMRGRRPDLALAAMGILLGSKAATEFGTSGLENALSALLVVAIVDRLRAGNDLTAALAVGLLVLNRLDHAVLIGPLVAQRLRHGSAGVWVLGGAIPAVWLTAATLWFGSPWPAPAVAKVAIDVPLGVTLQHGVDLVMVTAMWDPITMLGLCAATAAAARSDDPTARASAAGAALYMAYVVAVGGDFMVGRFFVTPLWLALAAATSDGTPIRPRLAASVAMIAAVGVASPHAPLRQGRANLRVEHPSGIADERTWHAPPPGSDADRWPPLVERMDAPATEPVIVPTAGALGVRHGPRTHVVEQHGLTDPFLARLPVDCTTARVGHCVRPLPPGFIDTLRSGQNHLVDPDVAACWDRVAATNRGPLTATGRATAILTLGLWGCDDLWRGRVLDADGRLSGSAAAHH